MIESPTFSFTVEQLKSYNIDVMTIPRDENGIDMEQLENIFKHYPIKFFYVITRNHNPLGTYLPYTQRKKIIELAHKYDVYIVENDYFSESFTIPKYDSIYYLSNFKNCIYLKSYTKLLPHIRVGFAIMPDDLLKPYRYGMEKNYYSSYYMPNLVSQAVLETTIKNNIIDVIGETVSYELKNKISIYNKIIKKWDQNILHGIPIKSGAYGLIKLNSKISIESFIDGLAQEKVFVKSAFDCYYNKDEYSNSFRVSLARVNEKDISKALQIIYDNAQKELLEL